ncbi:hypothetical protein EJ08DRAFT_172197 [Tothia fuscella]|uniref:Uncharacterized protein n=1 Tax=Tothia fuscella TaxID=1048955 RepID=A0A9P4NUM1_9PEZI|nr:hypothetical protein EJ08DRAFT_172197 [Tothia fuscella]
MMAISTKFSFPYPHKKLRPSTADLDASDSRNELPLSKAERLLGTSGLSTAASAYSLVSRPTMATKRSVISLASPTPYSKDISENDNILSPTRLEDVFIPPQSASARHDASSEAVGGAARLRTQAEQFGTITSIHTQQIKGSRSSLTMRSYYDSRKSPMEVSQQTSASAIRDRALRKGTDHAKGGARLQRSSEGRTKEEKLTTGKKRPAGLDLGKVFTRPSFARRNFFSPNKSDDSSMSHTSEYFPYSPHGRKLSNASSRNTRRPGSAVGPLNVAKPFVATIGHMAASMNEFDMDNIKTHVRKPPRGAQNWFDGLLEEEDEIDLEMQHGISNLRTKPLSSRSQLSSPQYKIFSPDIDQFFPATPDLSHSLHLQSAPFLPENAEYSDFDGVHGIPLESRPSSSPSVDTKASEFAKPELGDVSVLSVSSECEYDDDASNVRLPKMRDSIQVSESDSILIGKAQAFELRPKQLGVAIRDHGRQLSDGSSRSAISMATGEDSNSIHSLTNGSIYRVMPHQGTRRRKSGHTRQPSSIQETSDDETAERKSPTQSKQTRGGPRIHYTESHKLMAVTEEEEALLEMMRRKRAAMAKHSFAEGYKTALRQDAKAPELAVKTPKTPTKQPVRRFKLHPDTAPQPPRTSRARQLSTSSSILDSFPVARSQRHSLLRSNSSQTDNSIKTTDTCEVRPGRSAQSRPEPKSRRMPTPPFNSFSPSSQTFSLLTLAPLDCMLGPITSPTLEPSNGTDSPSSEPCESPTTPETRRSSLDVMVRQSSSQRNSQMSYSLGAIGELEEGGLGVKISAPIVVGHSRTRTASSEANFFSSEDSDCGNGDSIDPALRRKSNRTSIASVAELKRQSLVGSFARGHRCKHSSHRNSMISNNGSGIDTRCSVSEDVLAAWGSLGGWKEPGI